MGFPLFSTIRGLKVIKASELGCYLGLTEELLLIKQEVVKVVSGCGVTPASLLYFTEWSGCNRTLECT